MLSGALYKPKENRALIFLILIGTCCELYNNVQIRQIQTSYLFKTSVSFFKKHDIQIHLNNKTAISPHTIIWKTEPSKSPQSTPAALFFPTSTITPTNIIALSMAIQGVITANTILITIYLTNNENTPLNGALGIATIDGKEYHMQPTDINGKASIQLTISQNTIIHIQEAYESYVIEGTLEAI